MMTRLLNILFHSHNRIFENFSPPHMAILTLVAGLVYALMRLHSKFGVQAFHRLDPKSRLRKLLLGIMLAQQIMLYSWYAMNDAFNMVDALPLYPCRISSLLCIWMLVSWRRDVFNLLFFMGLSGAPLALLLPDTSHLGFPNVMFIQFFIGHAGILLTVTYLSLIHGFKPEAKDLLKACRLTLFYMLALVPLNLILGSNYGYMASKPDIAALAFLPGFPMHIPFFIGLMFLLYSLLFLLIGGYKYLVPKTQ